jgi:hypothetical protein
VNLGFAAVKSLAVPVSVAHAYNPVTGADAVCDQKILVFVLQREKAKQSTWMR